MQRNLEGWQAHMAALRKMSEYPNAKSQFGDIQFAIIEYAFLRTVKITFFVC
jgi:hypothetical protein